MDNWIKYEAINTPGAVELFSLINVQIYVEYGNI